MIDLTTETVSFHGRTFTLYKEHASDFTEGEGAIMGPYFDCRPGDVFVDVGAAHSTWTIYGLASGATVHAFEPSRPYYDLLVREVDLTPSYGPLAHLYCMGLDDVNQDKTLEDWYEGAGGPGFEVSPDCTVTTPFRRLDDLLPDLQGLDWMKLDVEGGELTVLKGARKHLAKYHPTLIIENHINVVRIGDWMRATNMLGEMRTMLEGLGYNQFEEVPHQGRSFIIAGRGLLGRDLGA
jgi:FkbM family methyltransferase